MAQLMVGQDRSGGGRGGRRHAARRAAGVGVVAIMTVATLGLAIAAAEGPHLVGGCRTVEREFGLPALQDSSAVRAFDELIAPGMGPKAGPACRQLRVDAPLFVTIGAVTEPADSIWVRVASHVTARMLRCEIRPATRSPLRCTSGTCFPPYHVDFEAVGDSAQVSEFLKELTGGPWDPLIITSRRAERTLFVAAGVSRETLDTVVDLKLR